MNFDKSIKNNDLIIFCSKGLEGFSNEFIDYFNGSIKRVKEELSIDQETKLRIVLTDDEEKAGFVYGKTAFSGFFNDTGAFAYINIDGDRTKKNLFQGLMHELVHHLYKYYVYGSDNERITWVDEGLAQLLSGQKNYLNDKEKYYLFLEENLRSIDNVDLNGLNHDDKSFGNNNGYNLSYIAIRYLYETYSHEEFIDIIKSKEKLLGFGSKIINQIKSEQNNNNTERITGDQMKK